MADRSFDNARIIVTGATGAFGSRLARRLTDEGAVVIATGRDEQKLGDVAAAERVVADLREASVAKRILDAAGGQVDGLINAAGVVAFGPLADTPDDVISQVMDVNAVSPLRLLMATVPHLSDGGFIAAITGVIAAQPMAGLTTYSASKAAMSASLVALRRELRTQKIDVIDLQPPHTETGLADHPVAGTAPKMPDGADPDAVVDRILQAIRSGERLVEASAFG